METWAIDGVDLLDLATDVQRVDKNIAPPLRGDDVQYAFRPGAGFRTRVTDSQTITLGLWLMGQDGTGTTDADFRNNYAAAERTLVRLLRPDGGGEFTITRTWTDDLGTHTATGHGSAAGLERARAGRYAGKVTVDVSMADPFFYGAPVDVPLVLGVPATVTNTGDETTASVWVELDGQLSNPVVTNSTPDPEVWFKIGTDLAIGDTVTVDGDGTAVLRASDGANLIGALTHSGAKPWMLLRRGDNTVTLTADAGAGSGLIRHWPVYY